MLTSQKHLLRISEIRSRLRELAGADSLEADQAAEVDRLRGELDTRETQYRASVAAENVETTDGEGDAESRERQALRSRFSIGRVLAARAGIQALGGAEAEYMAATESDGQVPVDVFHRSRPASQAEERAVTPGVAGGTEQRPIVPAVFERSVAPFLGIAMPAAGMGDAAFPVLSTSLTADVKDKGGAVPSTAGAFTVSTQQPRRIGAGFQIRYEDLARLEGMEMALRRNIQDMVAVKLDDEVLNGAAAAYNEDGEIRGLLAQLADPDDPAAGAEDWGRYHAAAVSHLADPWAVSERDIRILVGTATFKHMAQQFRATESNESFTAYWQRVGGGVRLSGKLAAAAGNIQQAVVARANPAMDQAAVMPHWSGFDLQIRDVYTDAAEGMVNVTVHMLVGDVVLLRGDVYVQDSFRLAA